MQASLKWCCRQRKSPLDAMVCALVRESFELSKTEFKGFKDVRKYIRKNFPNDIGNLFNFIIIFLTGIDKQFITNLNEVIKKKEEITNFIDLDLIYKVEVLEYFLFY